MQKDFMLPSFDQHTNRALTRIESRVSAFERISSQIHLHSFEADCVSVCACVCALRAGSSTSSECLYLTFPGLCEGFDSCWRESRIFPHQLERSGDEEPGEYMANLGFPFLLREINVQTHGLVNWIEDSGTLRSLSRLLGDFYMEFWGGTSGGIRGYSGGICRSFWMCFRVVWKETTTKTYNPNNL